MRNVIMMTALAISLALPANAMNIVSDGAAVADDSQNSEALALAALMLNPETVDVSLREGFDTQFRAALFADPASAAIFGDHPELVEKLIAALKPVLRDRMVADLPNVQAQLASIMATEMSAKQISASLAFLNTPVGNEAFISGVAAGAQLADETADRDKIIDDIAGQATSEMGPEDEAKAVVFVLSGASEELRSLTPAIKKLTEDWGKQVSDDNQAIIVTKTTEVFTQYFTEE